MSDSDARLGVAIRFIKGFDIVAGESRREDTFTNEGDAALFLAGRDKREIPFADKLADAVEFMRTRPERRD